MAAQNQPADMLAAIMSAKAGIKANLRRIVSKGVAILVAIAQSEADGLAQIQPHQALPLSMRLSTRWVSTTA